jgi:hypothetical protein
MIRKSLLVLLVLVAVLALAIPAYAKGGRAGALGVIYVSSQGLYYDTFVTADSLPMHGPFQYLENHVTEFGPGDPGYLGGRWWVDANGNGVQDEGDTFLLCPLLGPGRTEP